VKNNMKKNDTSNNDMMTEIKDEFKRHTNILMEKMDSTVKTVTEQYSGIAEQMSEIKSDVKELKNDIAIVKPVVERNSKDIQELKKDVHVLKNDVQGLKTDMREVKSELHSMNMALMETSHETKDHGKRIKKIEEKVFI